ncbi:MAG: LysM peptidoglycan-binding domain-containing protein [Thermoflexales bacterium]|nr:LysM peptidoglycan-binding domain-containing protein [Thermoflexales bacterium]
MNTRISLKDVLAGTVAVVVIALFAGLAVTQGVSSVHAQVSPLPTPPAPAPTAVWPPLPTAWPPAPTAVPPAPTAVPAQPAAQVLGYHTVRAGETLFCIGRAYAILPWAIATQNNLVYPYNLYTGQVLAIPNSPWVNPSAGAVCAAQFGDDPIQATPVPAYQPRPTGGCQTVYTVRYGDTLYSIARRYGTTVWAIASANRIANPNLIFAGQRLCIP